MSKNKTKWGILGCAGIARKQMIPAIQQSDFAELWAIGSRAQSKAIEWKDTFGFKKAYGSYEQVLEDPNIDAVYIALPNALHHEWTIKASHAGKHVLCEKPFATNASEAEEMISVCQTNRTLVHEAFMWRFHPRTQAIVDIIREGRLGKVRLIRGSFSYQMQPGANVRMDAKLAGGALRDVGCYCINFARLMTMAEPMTAYAIMETSPDSLSSEKSIDIATTAIMEFPHSIIFSFSARFDSAYDGQWMEIVGTKGLLRVERPFNPPEGPLEILVNGVSIPVSNDNQFRLQVDAFAKAIQGETSQVNPLVPNLYDPVLQMNALDLIYSSAALSKGSTSSS